MYPNPMVMKTGSETFKIILWHVTLDTTIRRRYWAGHLRIVCCLVALDTFRHVFSFTQSRDRLVRIVAGGTSQRTLRLDEALTAKQANGLKPS